MKGCEVSRKFTLLIVDDVAKNIQVAANFLKDENYKLMFATSGENALRTIQENEIDLILLDIMMPGVDGFEVARRVKTTTKGKNIPIIFVTAKSDEESIKKGFAVGGVDYITKPFHQEELIARVNNHLELTVLRKDLERKVIEETEKRLKSQEMLIQTSKMADMGDMIGAIAHQWKQPLNSMAIVVQEVLETSKFEDIKTEDIQGCVDKVLDKVRFMSDTVGDFRNYFKLDKEYGYFDAQEAVQKVFNMLCPQFKKNSIKVHISSSAETVVYGIQNEFKQVVLNILNNARDNFIEKKIQGEIEIVLMDAKDFLSVNFQDNGGGVPEDIIYKIFEQNFTTKKNGNGIGLFMCKTIMQDHLGGDITVTNKDDGALFSVLIPKRSMNNQIIT